MPTRIAQYIPWVKVLSFERASLNTYLNGADIDDSDWQTVVNVIFDKNVAEPGSAWTALTGTPLESGAAIDGMIRSFDKFGNKYLLAACNKKLKAFDGSSWTDPYTGFTVENVPYSFVNYQNKTLVTNGTDDIVAFDPNAGTAAKYGLNPPRFFKRVAYFEADTAIEAVTGLRSAEDLVRYDPSERTGKARRSWKMTTTGAATTATVTSTPAATIDLSTYDNGEAAGSSDWVRLSLWHDDRSALSSVFVDLYSSATAYARATIPVADIDPELLRDNVWTYYKLSRADFIEQVATFSWSTITKIVITTTAVNTTNVVNVNVDNIYITNRAIEGTSYGKVIEDFGGGGWTYTAGMVETQIYNNYKYIKLGQRSVKVAIPAGALTYSMFKTVSKDLSVYDDQITSNTSDEICLFTYMTTTTGLTKAVMKIMQSDTVYWYHDLTPGTEISATTTGCQSYIRLKKSSFTAFGGITTWTGIVKIQIDFIVTGTARDVYLDKWVMEEYSAEEVILSMDSTETWTYSSDSHAKMNTDTKHLVKGDQSLMLKGNPRQTAYASSPVVKDLSQYAGGFTSGNDDLISFWVNWTNYNTIKDIEIRFDINAVDYATDYYSYIWTKLELKRLWKGQHCKIVDLSNKSMYLEVKKGNFLKVGTSANAWDDVKGVRIILTTSKGDGYRTKVFFDDLHMRRCSGMSGLYQWAVVFCTADGVKSGVSEWSPITQIAGSKSVLSNIPVSSDAACAYREVYRRGGTLGDEARLAFIIYDNITTTADDGIADYELGPLMDERIPTGTIRAPKGKIFGPVFKGRLTMYQVADNEDCLYFSNIGYGYAWDELKMVAMGSRVMGAWVDDDILYVSTKNGMKKIVDDLYNAACDPSLVQETGFSMPVVSPWAFSRADDDSIIATRDGVGIFNGYQFLNISDKVKDLLSVAYTQLEYIGLLYSDKRVFFTYRTASPSTYECYLGMSKIGWRKLNLSFCSMCINDAPNDLGEVYGGTTGGYIYKMTRGTGNDSSCALTSKDFCADDPFMDLIVDEIHVIARTAETSSEPYLTFQMKANQANIAGVTRVTPTLTTAYRLDKLYLNGNELDMVKGSTVGISISASATKHFQIKAIKLIGRATPRTSAEEIL